MEQKIVMASDFKQRCLALLDEVDRTKVPLVVTKHGKPVARVVPMDEPERRSLIGSVTFIAEDDEAYFSTGERWEADSE